MRPFLDQVAAEDRRSVDITSLGDAFSATDPGVHPAELTVIAFPKTTPAAA